MVPLLRLVPPRVCSPLKSSPPFRGGPNCPPIPATLQCSHVSRTKRPPSDLFGTRAQACPKTQPPRTKLVRRQRIQVNLVTAPDHFPHTPSSSSPWAKITHRCTDHQNPNCQLHCSRCDSVPYSHLIFGQTENFIFSEDQNRPILRSPLAVVKKNFTAFLRIFEMITRYA